MTEDNLNINQLLKQAVLNHNNQKFQIAEELYEKVIKLDPKNNIALNNLGTIHLVLNNFEKAIKYFEDSLKIKSDYLDAKKNLEIANLKFSKEI